MLKLEDMFSKSEYLDCLDKIEKREFFQIKRENKKYKYRFIFDASPCDNGVWKENYMISYHFEIGTSGLCCPCQVDDIDSYEEICHRVNSCISKGI